MISNSYGKSIFKISEEANLCNKFYEHSDSMNFQEAKKILTRGDEGFYDYFLSQNNGDRVLRYLMTSPLPNDIKLVNIILKRVTKMPQIYKEIVLKDIEALVKSEKCNSVVDFCIKMITGANDNFIKAFKNPKVDHRLERDVRKDVFKTVNTFKDLCKKLIKKED